MSIVETSTAAPGIAQWLPTISASVGTDAPLEVVETRLSWIIFTQQHAYKVKKPLDLGESHNRTLVKRHEACVGEYWLNQSLAPGVYMGVLPIAEDAAGTHRLNGKGGPVEWVVKMRRLNSDRNLLSLLKQESLTSSQVHALAEALGKFYLSRPPKTDGVDDLLVRLRRRVAEAASSLKAILPVPSLGALNRIHLAQLRYLDAARTKLNSRVCDGRVVDGHGDLRPEHIFFERRPLIIDCIEYSEALRKLDALDDLCLIAMECERRGRNDVSAAIMDCYSLVTGDPGLADLKAFYKSLHATSMAAAGVAMIDKANDGANSQAITDAIAYIKQAVRYVASFR